MKIILATLSIIITLPFLGKAQSVGKTDSLKLISALDIIFNNFENPDSNNFKKISTPIIYCNICEGTEDSTLMSRETFFNKYLKVIRNYENWKRAINSKKLVFFKEGKPHSDITVFLTTWEKDEYAKGHEGAQLGFHFKDNNGDFKLAGIESIP